MNKNYDFTDGREMQIGTMFCIGKNYEAHVREMGSKVPEYPFIFIKPPQAYVPDGSAVELPEFSDMIHHEVELVIVIGKDGQDISEENAYNHIAGFGIGLDLTLRDLQTVAKKNCFPWAIAKGFKNSAPLSRITPYNNDKHGKLILDLELSVNGEKRQESNTSMMINSIPRIISFLSKVFSLREGDCIFTGTTRGSRACE